MNKLYEEIKGKAQSAFKALAKECVQFDDVRMLLGAADATTSLTRSKVSKTVDTEWIDKIESALPILDMIIRNPSVAIEDVDEVLPVELSKHITEKSIKHLAQHTNFILDVKDDEVVPQKILNVFHEESFLTYENKFVNTLLNRLTAFVDKRLRALNGTMGIEMNYKFGYKTEFEHFASADDGRNSAKINLEIELTSPLVQDISEADAEINERYASALERVRRINMALVSYGSSSFVQKLGRNFIRPPVIRTNAILRNKNLRECLNLWEYIESYDKVGYTFIGDKAYELPSDGFISGMYSSAALQYVTLYSGIAPDAENTRLLSEKHLFDVLPEFDDNVENEEIDDYLVYDSEYRKTVPVSRLMNNRKKLSEDEKRIHKALTLALRADEMINAEQARKEAEKRRIARELEEQIRRLEEEARRLAEEEAKRLEEQRRLAAMREVEVRYRRSFLSRYIQSDDCVQQYYNVIKNALLSYKGVKARTSWSKESFKCGRTHIAKIDVKGKTLCLYLALNAEELDSKYNASSATGDCPVLMRVKSDRKLRQSLELIEMLMNRLEIAKTEREAEDYRLPYEETDALIERGLIKIVLPKGEVLDENAIAVKSRLSELEALRAEAEAKRRQLLLNVADEEENKITEAQESEETAVETQESEEIFNPTEADAQESGEAEADIQVSDEIFNLTESDILESDENAEVFEAKIDDLIKSATKKNGRTYISLFAVSHIYRGKRDACRLAFAFNDGKGECGEQIVIPYTREQYLALPRKKKKRVLMNVKALLKYKATSMLLEKLVSLGSDSERIHSRIEVLQAKLEQERKFLPNSPLWENAVKRVLK